MLFAVPFVRVALSERLPTSQSGDAMLATSSIKARCNATKPTRNGKVLTPISTRSVSMWQDRQLRCRRLYVDERLRIINATEESSRITVLLLDGHMHANAHNVLPGMSLAQFQNSM